ncbi:hypothetical protein FRB94_011118 [Tulasnella sp. JGI-2019a]|nr:hypothetical protein FRB94_011118 [Tulasnella sp. JGI-2019a]
MMADVQTSPFRYLVSYTDPIHHSRVPPSSQNCYPIITSTTTLSSTGSAARIARKRASHPGPSLPSPTGLTNLDTVAASSSISPSSTSSSSNQFVKLGTIDFDSIVRSLNYLPDAQSISKHRKPASTSTSASPPASVSGRAAAPSTLRSSQVVPNGTPVPSRAESTTHTPLFRIPVVPRPTPRLPLFHPHNTTPLPDISRKPTPAPVNVAGPSPAPARRSSARARKPAAKAMALSLGLASDGSTLDQQIAEMASAAGKEPSPMEKAEKKLARAGGGKSHKAKKPVVDQDAVTGEHGDEATAKTTTRRAPKRKITTVVDSVGGEEGAHSLSPSPARRPRRGAAATATAAVEASTELSAPSPLSNELVQEPDAPIEPGPAKKRKTDPAPSPAAVQTEQESGAGSPPAAAAKPTKPRTAKTPKAQKGRKVAAAKAPRATSDTLSVEETLDATVTEGAEEKPAAAAKDEESTESGAKAAEDEDEADEPEVKRLSYNIFEEPLDLKPRPRPVYKAHLKRGSSGSAVGEDKPAPRPRKTRKATRDDGRKESQTPIVTTLEVTAPSEADNGLKHAAAVLLADAMEVDVPPQVEMHATIV